ncbi:TIGR04255 family protein [Chroococcidiopsis sp. CCMEE 29]|uniref:TIGR04255 family protein n=1 Tax=Chroococcidiopsis sp. CCMEE 29 TaxID=155894 RepID=UPI00202143F7|nr:TIGR04255 family protein [Chroococcidiopsis sp. CCMEE 29]
MEKVVNTNPLIAKPPEEVPLKSAPLVRVIAQVRFPPILSIGERSFVGHFQEAIREKYPILQPEQTHGLILGPQGLMQTEPQVIWRFADTSGNWRVSLASDFISLETVAYSSRSDFLNRLKNVLLALDIHIKPQIVERFGLRYIDRLVSQEMKDISKLVRPEIAGILATEVGKNVHQTINESLFNLPEGQEQIIARWGLLPANATIDPAAVEPIAEPSWVLDLDMSLSTQRAFSVEGLVSEAWRFAERIYTVFRWVVNDDFLQRFGGEL